ncbi:hypothetical protein [Emticicia sp. 17c]|uniref:hypothetical protein n=1 Tax=Emticicia sp. 17c TaxID=3127704 RepID=UPI00301C0324
MKISIQPPNRSLSLADGLLAEINRVQSLINLYESLPDNIGLSGALKLQNHIQNAEKAIQDNDIFQMLQFYSILKDCH